MMVIGKDKVVVRILPRHFDEFLKRGNTEFAICIGNPIPVLIASAVQTRLGESELSIANALKEIDLVKLGGHEVPESEIVMIAEMTGETHPEGPFIDVTETPDPVREQKVAKIKEIFIKENPIYHALLPGGLEHKLLMGMPQESMIFKEVSKICKCKDVLVTLGGCSWLHAVISIEKRTSEDGKKAIETAFETHASLKHVWVTDDDIDIRNPEELEWAMATRFQGDRDIIIRKEKGSSLDPSSDPETYETTKMGFDLTIPWEKDPKIFKKPELPLRLNLKDYLT
jgi:UbiD family decarboxylase